MEKDNNEGRTMDWQDTGIGRVGIRSPVQQAPSSSTCLIAMATSATTRQAVEKGEDDEKRQRQAVAEAGDYGLGRRQIKYIVQQLINRLLLLHLLIFYHSLHL